MRFMRFRASDDLVRVGVVDDFVVCVIPGLDDLLPLVQQGEAALRAAGERALAEGERLPVASLTALSPIETPPTFRDFYAFEQHVKAGRSWRGLEMDPLWYEIPVFYFSNPYAFRGAGEVAVPPGAGHFDFELEVAAIVGKGGSDLTPEQGEDAIVGYAVLNDWSARDIQHEEMRLSMGPVKGKDTTTSLGPCLVTKDELAPFASGKGFDRTMTLTVNGVEYSRANWKDVSWSFGEMVAYASRGTEVRPGDVIGSGTCGTGCILELSRTHGSEAYPWLAPGDEVVATVEGLGSLVSTVVAGKDPVALRSASEGPR